MLVIGSCDRTLRAYVAGSCFTRSCCSFFHNFASQCRILRTLQQHGIPFCCCLLLMVHPDPIVHREQQAQAPRRQHSLVFAATHLPFPCPLCSTSCRFLICLSISESLSVSLYICLPICLLQSWSVSVYTSVLPLHLCVSLVSARLL